LKSIFSPYIYALFFVCLYFNANAQNSKNYNLKIVSADSVENSFLSIVKYTRKFSLKKNVLIEINKIVTSLKKEGYYTVKMDSLIKIKQEYKAYVGLGTRTTKAIIRISNHRDLQLISSYYKIKSNQIEMETNQLESFIQELYLNVTNSGRVFSEISLKNHSIKKNTLIADLHITYSEKRKIDRILIKGFDNFPKNFLKHYFKLNKSTTLNNEKLTSIQKQIQLLKFASEIKPPELLFSKDSTLLYIYLKKNKANSFDGLVNFSSKTTEKGIQLNGYLNLKLQNTLNFGEEFYINWRNTGSNKQALNIHTSIPYIANTNTITNIGFEIYKQDSIFTNTKASLKITIPINKRLIAGLFYTSEKSVVLGKAGVTDNAIGYKNFFTGTEVTFNSLLKNRFEFTLKGAYGKREKVSDKKTQYKLEASASILIKLNNNISLFLRNVNGYLDTNDHLINESFRIGGTNSLRGFSEESLFTTAFSYINSEFRLLTKKKSYLYSVIDVGIIKQRNTVEKLSGIGFGYLLKTKHNLLDISYVIGKTTNTQFNLNTSKISIKMLTFF